MLIAVLHIVLRLSMHTALCPLRLFFVAWCLSRANLPLPYIQTPIRLRMFGSFFVIVSLGTSTDLIQKHFFWF
jgi:hypothetical protein